MQQVDARIWDDKEPKRRQLVLACANLVKLQCDLSSFHSLCHKKAEFPRLEMLDLAVGGLG